MAKLSGGYTYTEFDHHQRFLELRHHSWKSEQRFKTSSIFIKATRSISSHKKYGAHPNQRSLHYEQLTVVIGFSLRPAYLAVSNGGRLLRGLQNRISRNRLGRAPD